VAALESSSCIHLNHIPYIINLFIDNLTLFCRIIITFEKNKYTRYGVIFNLCKSSGYCYSDHCCAHNNDAILETIHQS
jgi:hypothetical protein